MLASNRDEGEDHRFTKESIEELARKLSPRDYEYGHGAEEVYSVQEYLESQDFTINQALVIRNSSDDWHLYTTQQAVIDTEEAIIRPTLHEFNKNDNWRLSVKLALKALRLLSELQTDGVEGARIQGINLRNSDSLHHDPVNDDFMQILQMDKALELGEAVSWHYLNNLRKYRMQPHGTKKSMTPEEVYRILLKRTNFEPSEGARRRLREYDQAVLGNRLGRYIIDRIIWKQ